MATSDARNSPTVAAINAAVTSAGNRYSPPEEQRRWKMIWARYWCFKPHKREKRIVPTASLEGAAAGDSTREWSAVQAGRTLAPPSSPASFVNSTVQSPANFNLSLSGASASMCSPGRPNTMFMIGPYAYETQLVSPPVFSTLTTEPSTAPFTPPPEFAHLTTPSSPEVPFAQYFTSSLEAKRAATETVSPLYTSNFASPCDTPASYTPISSHLYLGSPVAQLVSPTGGYSGELVSHKNNSALPSLNGGRIISSFPSYDPFASANFAGVSFASFILPSDTISKCEEQPSSLLVQPNSVQEIGGAQLHSEVEGILANERGASSSSEELCKTSVKKDRSSSLLQKDPCQAFDAVEAKLGFQLDRGGGSCSMPIMGCQSDTCSKNQDIERIVGSFSKVRASEAIKKSEKLQELLAHERNEVAFWANPLESGGTFPAYHAENVIKRSGKAAGDLSEKPASKSETVQRDNFL